MCWLLMAAAAVTGWTPVGAEARAERLEALSPGLDWIKTEGFRCGYNHWAPLDWYPRAKACGMNGIFSRMEIANDPSGDEAVSGNYPADGPVPEAVGAWRLVRPSSRAARANGLRFFYMLNLASARHNIDDGLRDDPRRFNNGPLFSPLDDLYWTRVVENRFLRVADMLAGDEYQLDGFLIDPEMYGEGGAIPGDIDYGDYALAEFVKATGETLQYRGLAIPERARLIAARGLKANLYAFEFERVKGLAQRTREKLQARVPDAILGFFLWRDVLWFRAVAAGFSTPRVPCLVGPESTYPGAYDEGFERQCVAIRKQAGVPILLVPGLSLGYGGNSVEPDLLQALTGNLYRRSIDTEGYWFWALTRLGKTDAERKPFLDLLGTVNRELDRWAAAGGAYDSPLRAAPLPAGRPANLQQVLADVRGWHALPADAMPVDSVQPAGATFRGLHTFAVPATAGEELAVEVQNVPLGAYTAPTACTAYRPDGSPLPQPDVALGKAETLRLTANVTGLWVLGITAHNNAFWVLPETRHCVVVSDGPFALCRPCGPEKLNRLFFYVPVGVQQFEMELLATQAEPASFRVLDAAGAVRHEQRVTDNVTVTIAVPPEQQGEVWRVEASDVVEDHGFRLIGLPNVVALKPEQLLAP